jgi:hypothetical protein
MVQRGVSHCFGERLRNFFEHFHTVFNRTVENFNPAFTKIGARDAHVASKLLRALTAVRLKIFRRSVEAKSSEA